MQNQQSFLSDVPVVNSLQAASFLRDDLRFLDHEESWVLFLNSACKPLAKKMITVGTILSTPIDHRRIIKEALNCNATAIILFHNHPGGNPRPSSADIKETEKLRSACNIFDISLADHIIITDARYFSFSEENEIKF